MTSSQIFSHPPRPNSVNKYINHTSLYLDLISLENIIMLKGKLKCAHAKGTNVGEGLDSFFQTGSPALHVSTHQCIFNRIAPVGLFGGIIIKLVHWPKECGY